MSTNRVPLQSPPTPGPHSRTVDSVWQYLRPAIPVVLFVLVLVLLQREFSKFDLAEIRLSFRSISGFAIAAAIGLTICNYVLLIGYDWLGVRLVQHPIKFRQVALAALLSYAFSNSLGFILGGTPIRVRLYTAWGMSAAEVVRLVIMIGFAFWLGLLVLGGVLFIATPFEIPSRFNLPLTNSRPLGLLMLIAIAAMLALSAFCRKPFSVRGVNLQPPPLRIVFAQAVVAALDFVLTAGVLFVLLPAETSIGFWPFVGIFLLATVIALATHVPGGLGVLELVLLTMLPQASGGVVASLLAFRVVYFFLPLVIAIAAISVGTLRLHWQRTQQLGTTAVRWVNIISPSIITGGIFVAGLVLLASGSLPAAEGRMALLRDFLPLPMVEISHFFASLIGALLIVLARGLQRRIDAAWALTVALLALGAVVSMAKGFDYETASILAVMMLVLILCRRQYYRRSRLLDTSSSVGWTTLVPMSLAIVVWLALNSYRHVEYSGELWWDFAFQSDAPRTLRALVGAAAVFLIIGIANVLGPISSRPEILDDELLNEVTAIVKSSRQANAHLALLGDKRFIFSDDRKAFVMFGCEGKSWIAMGDPVGSESSVDDAAWRFREACDQAGARPVFYQVNERSLGRYIEMGLAMIKLGETARVRLKTFSLQGSAKKELRYTNRKAGEWGLQFAIIPQAEVASHLPTLKAISDAWLREKSAAEKRFSLGNFREQYLCRGTVALVMQNNETIAFANVWLSDDKHELSIDLMRYRPDAPHGVMEYLFTQLMLWGNAQGYEWFDLGMAPLSGVDSHRLGPIWNRLSSLVFQHGEHFYNFKGLRTYKNKFGPEWFPKYLASPGGITTPQVLANVATLISGGVPELFRGRKVYRKRVPGGKKIGTRMDDVAVCRVDEESIATPNGTKWHRPNHNHPRENYPVPPTPSSMRVENSFVHSSPLR